MNSAEIYRELCAVYNQNVMSGGTVRQWCRMFKDGRRDVHDEERSGRPFVVSDGLVQSVDQKISGRRGLTISELSCEFPKISCTVLYQIITIRLAYHKFCASDDICTLTVRWYAYMEATMYLEFIQNLGNPETLRSLC
jgi:hypothetical protein